MHIAKARDEKFARGVDDACRWRSRAPSGLHGGDAAVANRHVEVALQRSRDHVNDVDVRENERSAWRLRFGHQKRRAHDADDHGREFHVHAARVYAARQALTACARTWRGRGLRAAWRAEWLHRDALVTHIENLKLLGAARRVKDHTVAWPGLHQRA